MIRNRNNGTDQSKMGKAVILFQIRYDNTSWGDNIYLTGNCAELGNWDDRYAIKLTCHDALWCGYVAVETNKPIEYKYFFRNNSYTRWEVESHYRCFDLEDGAIAEVRDRWHDYPDFTSDVASSSFIRDVCMHREHPNKLPTVTRPGEGEVTVVFEAFVPLVSPVESVHLIGASKSKKFWRVADSIKLYDADCPTFNVAQTYKVEDFPVRYKFVLSNDLGDECESIESGEDNQCFSPISIDTVASSSLVWVVDSELNRPHCIKMEDAIKQGVCKQPKQKFTQIIYIESQPFRYPNAPRFRACGMVLPVFSMRSKKSLGIGEFTDLVPLAEWCEKAGIRLIQLLPITDTTVNFVSWQDSYPYSSVSNYALHPIYMHIDDLTPLPPEIEKELPKKRESLDLPQVDYEETLNLKLQYMEKIFALHKSKGLLEKGADADFEHFKDDSSYWLPSYCCFKALAKKFHTTDWRQWPNEYKNESGLNALIDEMFKPTHELYNDVLFNEWIQYHLDKQLRAASQTCARKHHVGLKGDIPIGVDPNSTDTWYFRKYFRMNTKAGAPPDAFAQYGQNWGFPTYNWEAILHDNFEWWAHRLHVMSRFFHAYRIDHILGFFRIWEIPASVASGLHARFFPGYMVTDDELNRRGLNNAYDRLTRPIITRRLVFEQFGEEAENVINHYLEPLPPGMDGDYRFKSEFSDETRIVEEVKREKHIGKDASSDVLSQLDTYLRKFWVLTNSVCLYRYGDHEYVPRFDVRCTESCKLLGGDWQEALDRLSDEYFHKWHQDEWERSAMSKFPKIKDSSHMLICGEDLGLLSPVVPRVMERFHILGLRVQRMTGDPNVLYYHPENYGQDVVATTSTHDMPPLRAWWQVMNFRKMSSDEQKWFGNTSEVKAEQHVRDLFWYHTLGNTGDRPFDLPNDQLERIIDMHMYSPAMLAIFPYQDLVAILKDDKVYHEDPWDEVINVPAIRTHYWRYRMPCFIEDLMKKDVLTKRIRGKIENSGRLHCH